MLEFGSNLVVKLHQKKNDPVTLSLFCYDCYMTDLPKNDSLRELQKYIWQMNIERGFNTEDASKKLVMLMEESGELAKAVRKHVGMKFSDSTKQQELREELADVQIVLLGLASTLDEDMFSAVIDKEKKNRTRKWK